MKSCFTSFIPDGAIVQEFPPEQSLLLGLAFRKGILVKQSTPYAVDLLLSAAAKTSEASLKAAEQLAYFYEFDSGFRDSFSNLMGSPSREALKWRIRCLDLSKDVFGQNSRHAAIAYNNLGLLYDKLGEYDKAMDAYKNDLDICLSVLGKEHTETATTYDNISQLFIRMNDYDRAIEMGEISLGIKLRVLDADDQEVARSYNNTANAYLMKGEYGKALEYQKKAIDIRERVLGMDDADIAVMYYNIGTVYAYMEDYKTATHYCRRALTLMVKYFGSEHIKTRTARETLGSISTNIARTDEGYLNEIIIKK